MSKKILLISEPQLINESWIEKNADSKLLSKIIVTVQEIKLKPILGAELYNQILNEVYSAATNNTIISSFTKQLVDEYIKPYLIHAVMSDFILISNYKFTSKGVLKLNDDSGSNVSSSELQSTKDFYTNHMTNYKMVLIQFLIANNKLPADTDVDITSDGAGWFFGIKQYSN